MNHWNSVIYQGKGSTVPAERWGHRILKVEDELLLFGGYGGIPEGQGKYLQDIWKFDLHRSNWIPLKTTGCIPEARSNYTIHYHSTKQQVVLFGGGTEAKVRFNTVHILNLPTLQWRKITPQGGQQAPWERTYHTSEICQNFLIVFGGQGISNLDLEDIWAFDLETQKWSRLDPQGDCPTRRRFASSAVVGSDFYLIGGCQDNYHLIGELHRLSLRPLLEGNAKDLKWQLLLQKNNLLSRWGHSSDVYDNKIYIFSGRVSDERDNNDFIQYDCLTGVLQKIQTMGKVPEARRRHATAVVGSSLLVFGGYNAKYFNDFYHIKLSESTGHSQPAGKAIVFKTKQKFLQEMQLSERVIPSHQHISVADDSELWQCSTEFQKLNNNPYFRSCLKYGKLIQLPSVCTLQVFRIVHLALIYGRLYLWQQITLSECFEIAQALQYFCMSQHLNQLQYFLISRVQANNAFEILAYSTRCSMDKLGTAAAMAYLLTDESQSRHKLSIQSSSLQQIHAIQVLRAVQKQNNFELIQRKLGRKELGPFSKTLETIKMILCKQSPRMSEERKLPQRKRSCLLAVWQCLQQMNRIFSFYGAVGI